MRISKEDISISIFFDEDTNEWIASATCSANYTAYKKTLTNFQISARSPESAIESLKKLLKQIELI